MQPKLTVGSSSSNSFSLLPSKPKIFHGRTAELAALVGVLTKSNSGRIAILGAGGMGKTSLARATLHHPEIIARYENRFFVSADSATNSIELAALLGAHVGLKPSKNLTRAVVQYFAQNTKLGLLVLDNLETPWEPRESRTAVEEFLALLSGVPHLALIVRIFLLK